MSSTPRMPSQTQMIVQIQPIITKKKPSVVIRNEVMKLLEEKYGITNKTEKNRVIKNLNRTIENERFLHYFLAKQQDIDAFTKAWSKFMIWWKGLKKPGQKRERIEHFPSYVKKHLRSEKTDRQKYKDALDLYRLLRQSAITPSLPKSQTLQKILQSQTVQTPKVSKVESGKDQDKFRQELNRIILSKKLALVNSGKQISPTTKSVPRGGGASQTISPIHPQINIIWNSSNLKNTYKKVLEEFFEGSLEPKVLEKNTLKSYAYQPENPQELTAELESKYGKDPSQNNNRIVFIVGFMPGVRCDRFRIPILKILKKFFNKIYLISLNSGVAAQPKDKGTVIINSEKLIDDIFDLVYENKNEEPRLLSSVTRVKNEIRTLKRLLSELKQT